jgi:hypothetical protein
MAFGDVKPTSALGQKQTSEDVKAMSALPPKADIRQGNRDVRFVPKADITWSVQMWVLQVLLLRPGAIVPMESTRYQGYERRGASSAF